MQTFDRERVLSTKTVLDTQRVFDCRRVLDKKYKAENLLMKFFSENGGC